MQLPSHLSSASSSCECFRHRWFLCWRAARKNIEVATAHERSKKQEPTNRIFSNCRTLLGYTINAVTTGTTTAIVQRRELASSPGPSQILSRRRLRDKIWEGPGDEARRESVAASLLLTSSLLRFTEVYGGDY